MIAPKTVLGLPVLTVAVVLILPKGRTLAVLWIMITATTIQAAVLKGIHGMEAARVHVLYMNVRTLAPVIVVRTIVTWNASAVTGAAITILLLVLPNVEAASPSANTGIAAVTPAG